MAPKFCEKTVKILYLNDFYDVPVSGICYFLNDPNTFFWFSRTENGGWVVKGKKSLTIEDLTYEEAEDWDNWEYLDTEYQLYPIQNNDIVLKKRLEKEQFGLTSNQLRQDIGFIKALMGPLFRDRDNNINFAMTRYDHKMLIDESWFVEHKPV